MRDFVAVALVALCLLVAASAFTVRTVIVFMLIAFAAVLW